MKHPILAAAAAVLSLSLAAAAHAQTAAPAPAIDPVKMALARQVVEATGGQKTAEAQMRGVYANIGALVSRISPPGQSQLGQQMMADIQEEMIKLVPQMLEISTRAQAQNFTEQELRDLLVFYKSPTGQSVLRKMPVVVQQTMNEEAPMIQAMMPGIMQKTLDRACAESKCTPEVRQIMAEAMAKAMARPKS